MQFDCIQAKQLVSALMPAISVIIPVYNGAATIAQTLRSALAQTFTDIEILVVDDGSTDGTAEIVRSFADSRVRLLTGEHHGIAATRNRGVREAQAPYVAFLDADDLWTADKLRLEWQRLHESPDAAVSYSWTCYISESNELLDAQPPVHCEGNVLPAMLVGNLLHSGSNGLVRKTAMEEIGGFRGDVQNAEDWDCFLRLAARHLFVLVPQYQVLYRQRTVGKSSNPRTVERSNLRVLERAFAAAPAELHRLRPAAYANLHQYLAILNLVRRTDSLRIFAAAGHLGRAAIRQPQLIFAQKFWRHWIVLGAELLVPRPIRRKLKRYFKTRRLQASPELESVRQTLRSVTESSV